MNIVETKIRTRIDEKFANYAPSEELTELKEELVADLDEIANDNIQSGKGETEAIESAFEHLGDIDELMQEFEEARKDDQSKEETKTENIVKIGKFAIDDDKITYDNKVIIDEDKIDLGSFLKVEDGSVDMGNGFFRVDDEGVSLGKDQTGNIFNRLSLVNSARYDLSKIENVTVNYKNDQIEVKQSPNEELIINEYMSRNNARYYLNTTKIDDSQIYIKQGDRPIMWHIHAKIEICIPRNYANKINIVDRNGSMAISEINSRAVLSATASNGAISIDNTELACLNLFCANGAIKVNNLHTSESSLVSNNGAITGMNLSGNYTAKSRNGAIKLSTINGNGSFNSNNGAVKLSFNNVNGDINAYTKNGPIRLEIPQETSIEYTLQSKLGTVKNRLESTEVKFEAQGFVQGTIGGHPENKLVAKSSHGSVKLG